MGEPQRPLPVKLVMGIMYAPTAPVDDVVGRLQERWGAVEETHGPIPFTFSDYYFGEMGSPLLKRYIAFSRTIDRAMLPEIKAATNALEREYLAGGNRCINIDPGYLARDKLVLASTKDFFHRIYCDAGIYAEVTLHYRHGIFRFFSWTYPDYREPALHAFLARVRERLAVLHKNAG